MNSVRLSRLLFFLILLSSILVRFYQLGEMPNGLTNDEASYIYSAYSIWHTGKDVTGAFLPLSFNIDNSFSPVPVYLIAPIVGIFGMTPFTGRFLFAFVGVLTVIMLYFFTKLLFKNTSLALASMFVIAFSPWHIHFSRSAYDGILALFFLITGIYIYVRWKGTKKMLWSLVFFLLGFYSYHATKIFFIAFIPISLAFYWEDVRQKKKVFASFLIGIGLLFLSFYFVTRYQQVSRQNILIFNDSKNAAKTVDLERKINTAPFIVRQVFNNKPLYFLRQIRENYLEAFSPQFLFLYGETSGLSSIYGTSFRGMFYIIELPLLLLGIIVLSQDKKQRRNVLFLISLLLIAPLPSALTLDRSYGLRSIMMLPFLSIFIGAGILYVVNTFRRKNFGTILVSGFFLLYGFLIASYLYQYYFRYSLYGAEGWFYSSKNLVQFVFHEKNNYKNIYIANNGELLMQYAVFNKLDPEITRSLYKQSAPKKFENITFTGGCIDTHKENFDPLIYLPKSTLYIVPASCHTEVGPVSKIVDPAEPLRTIWKMYRRE